MHLVKIAIPAVMATGWLLASVTMAAAQDAGTSDRAFVAPVEVVAELGQEGSCKPVPRAGDAFALPGTADVWMCSTSIEASDDRLTGDLTLLNENAYLAGSNLEAAPILVAACDADRECTTPDLETIHAALEIRNALGAWRQRPTVRLAYPGSEEPTFRTLVLDGEASYDGFVAILEERVDEATDATTYYGFILDSRQLRPAPENASNR